MKSLAPAYKMVSLLVYGGLASFSTFRVWRCDREVRGDALLTNIIECQTYRLTTAKVFHPLQAGLELSSVLKPSVTNTNRICKTRTLCRIFTDGRPHTLLVFDALNTISCSL